MDLELLNCKFKVDESPGLDTLDPRFVDIAAMVQNSDFSGAAAQAQNIIEEDIYDIRIICYFLYGFFDERGPGAFNDIFISLERIFRENWEAIGPLKKRENHAKNSLNWFFKQANKILANEDKKKGPKWQAWQEEVSPDEIRAALDTGLELGQEIGNVLGKQAGTVVDGLTRITVWLETFYHLIYQEPEPEPEEMIEPDVENPAEEQGEESSTSPEIKPEAGPNRLNGSESYPLKTLIRKMDAFEQLLHENKNTGAALVANDINRIIADFDPQIYFPALFATFTRQFALNIEKFLAFDNCRDTPVWQSMEKLYNVDMDSFVALDTEFHFKDPDSFHQPGDGQNYNHQDGNNDAQDNEAAGYDDDGDDY
jgi:hypothetical protein